MARVLADRVKATTTTVGTIPFAMSVTVVAGYQLLATVMAIGDTAPYTAEAVDASGTPTGEWEVGIGTYTAANELTRTTILASSNSGAAVVFSAGTKNVFITLPATYAAWIREKLSANRTYYVRTTAAAVSFTNASANITWTSHGRSVNDAVVLSLQPNKGTFTVTIASPGVFTKNSHGYLAGQPLKFSTTSALPTGLTAGTTYYVIAAGLTTNNFEVSTTVGGSAVNTSGSQSGTHYAEATGAMPTFSTAGLLVAGTSYFVKTVVDANTITLSTTAGGTALGTATVATGSPLYIASSGSDTGDGLTAATGFLTRQRAADVISGTLDLNGYTVNVQLADSTYTSTLTLGPVVGTGTAVMQGNASFPANVLVSTTSADAVYATGAGSRWTFQDAKVQTTTAGYGLHADTFAVLHFGNIDFGPNAQLQIYANTPSAVWCDSAYTISGGAAIHAQADFGGLFLCFSKVVTLVGIPAFSSAFDVGATGNMYLVGTTYVGTATGPRYLVSANGVINCGTTLPGNSAGTASTGGQFI